jgi:peptide/nickel transport system substrate-binding protein
MHRSWTYAAVMLTIALAATACGGSDHHPAHHSDPCLGAVYNAGNAAHAADVHCGQTLGFDGYRGPYVVAGATRGGTVKVLTQHGLDGTIDPAAASDRAIVSILSGLVTRSLTQYRYDPSSKQMILVPDIATTLGEHNWNYTKWRFRIRPGVRFEDGSKVTAHDVVRGVRRCRNASSFPTSPCLEAPIRAITVQHQTLTFHLSAPYPDLPWLAAQPAFGPVPPGTRPVFGAYARHPLSTGPYRIQSYRRGHRLVLVSNSHWDTTTDPARTQYPDRYVFRAGLSDGVIGQSLRHDKGAAQTTLTFDTMQPGEFTGKAESDRLVLGGSPCTTYLSPDNRTITDPAVRRALIWAYPYRAVLHAQALTPGVTAVPATSLQPPGVPGRVALTVRGHRGFATQPQVARRMLTRAHALGTRLRFFYTPGDRTSVRIRDALVRSLGESGFDPEPTRSPSALFPGQTQANLPVDLRPTTRCGSWPSGEQWLPPVYRSTHPDRGGRLFDNTEAFSNAGVDREMRQIGLVPLGNQGGAWSSLDSKIMQRWQPIVPLWYAGVAMAHGSRIQGMADDTTTGMPTWKQLWVQQ